MSGVDEKGGIESGNGQVFVFGDLLLNCLFAVNVASACLQCQNKRRCKFSILINLARGSLQGGHEGHFCRTSHSPEWSVERSVVHELL